MIDQSVSEGDWEGEFTLVWSCHLQRKREYELLICRSDVAQTLQISPVFVDLRQLLICVSVLVGCCPVGAMLNACMLLHSLFKHGHVIYFSLGRI